MGLYQTDRISAIWQICLQLYSESHAG